MTLNPGARLGPYEILAALGAGGMGEVYRARDTRLGREVAVKVLPTHLSSNPEVRARFEREAKTVSSLNHPHICVLYDVGREGDTDFLVLELIEGETLATRLARGAVPIGDVLRIGTEIADALDKAHRAGIVHRDLKPGNVMLTKSGAKLMDFGLARAAGLAGPSSSGVSIAGLSQSPTVAQPLTAEGTIIGTFQYMSPEQLEGKETDERGDLWALGCLLYEMSTGRRAFDGKSQASLISSIMTAEPAPVSQVSPLAPPAFDRLVRTCLAKDPADRIQSAHDVRLQLVWIAEGGSQAGTAAPVSKPRRSRERAAWTIALAAVLVAAGGGFVAARNRPVAGGTAAHLALPMPAEAQFRSFRTAEISPDGRTVVLVGTDTDGTSLLYIRPIDRDEVRPVDGTSGASDPFWSPDGRNVGFFADGKLKRVPTAGGPPRVLCEAIGSDGASWGTAGVIVFGPGELQPVVAVPENGGTPRPVTKMQPLDEAHRWPSFLPDGRRFVYLADARRAEDHWLRTGSIDGDVDASFLQNAITNVRFVAPDWLFYVRGGTLLAQRFDTKKTQLADEPIPVANQVRVFPYHQYEFSCSAAGVVVFRSANPLQELAWYDRQGRRLETLGKPDRLAEVRLSPDTRRVAYTTEDADGRHDQIYLLDLERGITSRPTTGVGNYANPVWSPDGERLAFSGTATGTGCIYLSSISGTRRDQVVRRAKTDCWPCDWSRDGRWMLFVDSGDTLTGLFARPIDAPEGEIALATPSDVVDGARFSPDGRWFVYWQGNTTMAEVFVQDFPAAERRYQVSAGGGFAPLWTADGREILYQDKDDEILVAGVRTSGGFASDAPRKLFRVPGGRLVDAAPDGQRLLLKVPIQDPVTAPVHVILDWRQEVAAK